MSKRWIVMTLLGAAALMLGIGGQSGAAAAPKPKIAWSTCHRDLGPFECGTRPGAAGLRRPQSGTISLALVRLPATDPAQPDRLAVPQPGRPGRLRGRLHALRRSVPLHGRGAGAVRPRRLRPARDHSQHGRSAASATDKQWDPYFTPFAFPLERRGGAVWIAADHYLDDACARRGGRIGEHMSTANVARDLDVLRQARRRRRSSRYAGSRTARSSGRRTRTCSRARSARSWSTACSTRSRGRRAPGTSATPVLDPAAQRRGRAWRR